MAHLQLVAPVPVAAIPLFTLRELRSMDEQLGQSIAALQSFQRELKCTIAQIDETKHETEDLRSRGLCDAAGVANHLTRLNQHRLLCHSELDQSAQELTNILAIRRRVDNYIKAVELIRSEELREAKHFDPPRRQALSTPSGLFDLPELLPRSLPRLEQASKTSPAPLPETSAVPRTVALAAPNDPDEVMPLVGRCAVLQEQAQRLRLSPLECLIVGLLWMRTKHYGVRKLRRQLSITTALKMILGSELAPTMLGRPRLSDNALMSEVRRLSTEIANNLKSKSMLSQFVVGEERYSAFSFNADIMWEDYFIPSERAILIKLFTENADANKQRDQTGPLTRR